MSKVHSYYGSFACCLLLSMELLHDCRATLFFIESMTNASTFGSLRLKFVDALQIVLHISWAGSCVGEKNCEWLEF